MTRFFVSDLHLGDRGPRDNFAANEQAFGRFLDFVQANAGSELVVLGDLFDWWQCNLSASVLAYQSLIYRLLGMRALWVAGNHDNLFAAGLTVGETRQICICRVPLPDMRGAFIDYSNLLLMHGHECDPSCAGLNPGIGAMTAIMSGLLEDRSQGTVRTNGEIEDRFINFLEMPLNAWNRLLGHASMFEEVVEGVEDFRLKQRASAVIYGHTHEAGQIGKHHFNCGCWCRTRNTFVKHDTAGISIHEWTGDEAVPFERHLLG